MRLTTHLITHSAQGCVETETQGALSTAPTLRSEVVTNHQIEAQGYKPVDFVMQALASCTLSMVVVAAQKRDLAMEGVYITVDYTLTEGAPRRFDTVTAVLHLPYTITDKRVRTVLERTAHACPVALSLHPDVKQELTIEYDV